MRLRPPPASAAALLLFLRSAAAVVYEDGGVIPGDGEFAATSVGVPKVTAFAATTAEVTGEDQCADPGDIKDADGIDTKVVFDEPENPPVCTSPTCRKMIGGKAQCPGEEDDVGWDLLFYLGSNRRVEIQSCPSSYLLTFELVGDQTPFTAEEREFFVRTADKIEDGTTADLNNKGSLDAQAIHASRILADWPAALPVTYSFFGRRRDRRELLIPPPMYTSLCADLQAQSWKAAPPQYAPDGNVRGQAGLEPFCASPDGMFVSGSQDAPAPWDCEFPPFAVPPSEGGLWMTGNCLGRCGGGCDAKGVWSQFTEDCLNYDFCSRLKTGSDCSQEFQDAIDDRMWSGNCDKETGEEKTIECPEGGPAGTPPAPAPLPLMGKGSPRVVVTPPPSRGPTDAPVEPTAAPESYEEAMNKRWDHCIAAQGTCESCVDAGCAYIEDRCIPDCSIIADTPCFSTGGASCESYHNMVKDRALCSDHTTCEDCVKNIKTDGFPCAWFSESGSCSDEVCPFYSDCGVTTCDAITEPTEPDIVITEPDIVIPEPPTPDAELPVAPPERLSCARKCTNLDECKDPSGVNGMVDDGTGEFVCSWDGICQYHAWQNGVNYVACGDWGLDAATNTWGYTGDDSKCNKGPSGLAEGQVQSECTSSNNNACWYYWCLP